MLNSEVVRVLLLELHWSAFSLPLDVSHTLQVQRNNYRLVTQFPLSQQEPAGCCSQLEQQWLGLTVCLQEQNSTAYCNPAEAFYNDEVVQRLHWECRHLGQFTLACQKRVSQYQWHEKFFGLQYGARLQKGYIS